LRTAGLLDANQCGLRAGVKDCLQRKGDDAPARRTEMLMHLPIVILASLPFTTVADSAPKFDIARECQSEGGTKAVIEQCATDEAKARDQLQPEWVQFSSHDKAICMSETSVDGTASYVELLTCLEMARDVKNSSK
jgi:hypothetical protein